MKKIIISLLIVLIAFSISCNNKTDSYSIVVNMWAEPKTIDPSLNTMKAVDVYIIHAFEGLTKLDSNNNVIGGMAESWDISEDGLKYTFYLRTNAKWSDGKPVTAGDFEYSWKRAVNHKTASAYSYAMEIIKNANEINAGIMDYNDLGIKAIDDYTLEVILENPTVYFLEFIATTGIFMPIRKDIVETYGDEWTLNPETYIGNGPYKMTERLIDDKIVFSVNTNYYSKEEQIAKKITFILTSDPNTAIAGLKNGSIHFSALETPALEIENLKSENYIYLNNSLGIYYLELNITNDALKDKRVRQALALAIDRNYMISNVINGIPAGAFVPPQIKGLNDTFRNESKDYIDVNPNNHKENVEKAKLLMAEAGYPNGENYPILELKVSPGNLLKGEVIQQMWKENLNVTVQLIQEEFTTTIQSLIEKDYQLSRMGWIANYNDPMTMLDVMLSYGGVNHTGFSNANYDRLILIAKESPDNKVRMDAMREAESILMDEMPIIPIYYRLDALMISPKLKGAVISSLGKHRFNYCYIE